jgi:ABC-type lipoprotein release transport system permease subunit
MLVSGSSESAGAQVVGVFPEVEQQDRNADSQIIEGRYLTSEPIKEVIVGTTLFNDLDLKLGEELFVYTQASDGSMAYDLYNLVGVYKTGSTMLDNGMQLHVKDLQNLLILPSQYHEILVVDDSLEHISVLQTEIQTLLPDDDSVQAKTWWETSPQTKEMMSFQDVSSVMYLGIIFFIAGFGILNTMLMAVFERTRELGVMKALGMRAGQIIQVILIESVVLATLASILGLLMGMALNFYLQEFGMDLSGGTGEPLAMMGINFDPIMYVNMQWSTYPLPVFGLFVVAVLSSVWPAFRASRLHPVDAIRSE